MYLYVKLGRTFALFWEWRLAYTRKPSLSIYSCNGEYIIDMPYMQVIISPRAVLMREVTLGLKSKTQKGQDYEREKPYRQLCRPPSGTQEH